METIFKKSNPRACELKILLKSGYTLYGQKLVDCILTVAAVLCQEHNRHCPREKTISVLKTPKTQQTV